jgi:hypothetical protein
MEPILKAHGRKIEGVQVSRNGGDMSRWLFTPIVFLFLATAGPCLAQSANPASPPDSSQPQATAKTADPTVTSTPPVPAAPAKRVWTNDNLADASGSISVVGDKRNPKYAVTPARTGDPATAARIRQNLEKLQRQLDDVNKQLLGFKQFLEGETVSESGRDMSKGYSRTPVDQQIVKLQAKKKDLQEQIAALIDEARKKGIEPGQLR